MHMHIGIVLDFQHQTLLAPGATMTQCKAMVAVRCTESGGCVRIDTCAVAVQSDA